MCKFESDSIARAKEESQFMSQNIQVVRMHANELESSSSSPDPKNIKLYHEHKSFIMQFKYPDTTWIWALPIKAMYLNSIEDCLKSCERTLNDPMNVKYGVEVRIIDIVAPVLCH